MTTMFDAAGPRARRRSLTMSAAFGVVLVIAAVVAGNHLARQGQFNSALWLPIISPGNDQFGLLWSFLGQGMLRTLIVVALSMLVSAVAGLVVSVSVQLSPRPVRGAIRSLVELARAVPVVLLIFLTSVVIQQEGVQLDPIWYMVIAISLHNAAVLSEIVRAGVGALPKGQSEASAALGLRRVATLREILLPQALRAMRPALITQIILMVNESALGFIVSYPELLRSSQVAVQSLNNPLQMYLVVGLLYIAFNLILSSLSRRFDRSGTRRSLLLGKS